MPDVPIGRRVRCSVWSCECGAYCSSEELVSDDGREGHPTFRTITYDGAVALTLAGHRLYRKLIRNGCPACRPDLYPQE